VQSSADSLAEIAAVIVVHDDLPSCAVKVAWCAAFDKRAPEISGPADGVVSAVVKIGFSFLW
jgi:hypothetical protein